MTDPSALIFVALAVAWAVYLVPKALQRHDEVVRTRSVERFSETMRVLARRHPSAGSSAPSASTPVSQPVSSAVTSEQRVVVTPGREHRAPIVVAKARAATAAAAAATASATASATSSVARTAGGSRAAAVEHAARRAEARAERRAQRAEERLAREEAYVARRAAMTAEQRRSAANRAARKRLRVLVALVSGLALLGLLSLLGVVHPGWLAVPGLLLVAWLVSCRVMVRRETGLSGPLARIPVVTGDEEGGATREARTDGTRSASDDATGEVAVVRVQGDQVVVEVEPGAINPDGTWNPVPVHVPSYVNKPAAHREAGRLDLEDTGVWTSGRTEESAAIAREAQEAERASRRQQREGEGRAYGS
ncbi:hypothetical protein [Nocardioides sp. GY 10127]|uniref:hypothetical protein n=1 Tax=Nocardioides sp. GY 10127 TaxID=2569762 RepID=UPI0010A8A06E|nr:hypothetical protein [Nocardioides sp. GY 10127]TIC79150.1 hypothetical protein E8D37_18140 [Nocardioides sp. GY 10127]